MKRLLKVSQVICLLMSASACQPNPPPTTAQHKETCVSNMIAIAQLLRVATPVEPRYPMSLSSLTEYTTHIELFVCPSSGHTPGDVQDVDRWTDYIYVGGLPDLLQDPKVAVLICPPKYHGGRNGLVLFLTGEVEVVNSNDIANLVSSPWCLATNAPDDELQELRRSVVVRVPENLRNVYTNVFGRK